MSDRYLFRPHPFPGLSGSGEGLGDGEGEGLGLGEGIGDGEGLGDDAGTQAVCSMALVPLVTFSSTQPHSN